jgi:D-arginine dehydrogenase
VTVDCDFLIIGAGASGAGAGFELSAHGKVILLEAESQPGYHSTGRSAALYTRYYGAPVVRALNHASLPFLQSPPPGFADHPLLGPRGALGIAPPDAPHLLDANLALDPSGREIVEVSPARVRELVPILKPEAVGRAAYEEGVLDMDVHAIHQGYLRGIVARGGRIVGNARAEAIERRNGSWQVRAGGETYGAPVVVNAAGAWADEVGQLAGFAPIGLVPKRRSAVMVDVPAGADLRRWPAVDQLDNDHYFKPDAERLMVSPGDTTPSPPCDAQPEDLDIALVIDWFERVTTVEVRRLGRRWAGLRSFVADSAPVCGPEPAAEGFYWLAGQGGYGIMMSSSLGRATAGLVTRGELPDDIRSLGVQAADLSPARCRAS